MPVEMITSSENVDVGIKVETTSGTLATGAYAIFQTTGATLEFPSEEATDKSTGDHGGPISKRTTSRGGNASFPAHLRFDGNKVLIASAMRDDWPAEVTITGTSDINLLTGGTHADGSTGLQLTAPTGNFDTFAEYAGATANGAEALLMFMSGWATAANNQPVGIKAVHEAGGIAKIDIWPGYGGGSSGDLFGAPKTGETLKSAVLKVGSGIRNHQSDGSLVRKSYSILIDFFEHATAARFQALRGWVGNDINLVMNGKGEVMITVNGNGRGWTALQATPPTGETAGSHFTDATSSSPMYIGGDDLEFLVIVPYANAINATNVPVLLSDANVSAFNFTQAGGVQVVNDIVGTDETIPRKGQQDPSGNISCYQTDDVVAQQITQLGAKASRQYGAIHLGYKDDNGDRFILTLPKNNFQATGFSPGAAGSAVTGTLNFGSMRISKNGRATIIQQISG